MVTYDTEEEHFSYKLKREKRIFIFIKNRDKKERGTERGVEIFCLDKGKGTEFLYTLLI